MNSREAASLLEESFGASELCFSDAHREALVRAKQALEILATIEEKLGNRKLILGKNFTILTRGSFRDGYTYLGDFHGENLVDALGQATTVLALE